jgi:urea transporter
MRHATGQDRPDWVPRRLTLYEARSRSTRWLIARPERLLGWWLFLLLFGVLGVVLAMIGMPVYYLVPFIVPGWLQLVVDLRYMPRTFRAWRNSSGGSAAAPSEH